VDIVIRKQEQDEWKRKSQSPTHAYAKSQLFVGVDALGKNFDFGNTAEREQQLYKVVYGELLFGQSRVRRDDAKPECSSM
jgi:hypothetical protein